MVFIPKRENETYHEWLERVRRVSSVLGYPETPEWWIKLFPTERGAEKKEQRQQQDRGA